MACSSRSLITSGVAVAVAAVIAWRCRGSGRTQTAESPEEAAVGNLPTLTGPTEDLFWERASCFMMLLSSLSFGAVTIGSFGTTGTENPLRESATPLGW